MSMDTAKLNRLRTLDAAAKNLRAELQISRSGEVTFQAGYIDDEVLIVEADGYGGATLSIVEGNYPVDYFTKKFRRFDTEKEAGDAAERLDPNNDEAEEIDEDEIFDSQPAHGLL